MYLHMSRSTLMKYIHQKDLHPQNSNSNLTQDKEISITLLYSDFLIFKFNFYFKIN